MKNILKKAYQNRYFLLFILLFAYVESIYIRMMVRQEIDAYIFTPEAALATLLNAGILFGVILYFIRKWQDSGSWQAAVLLKISAVSMLTYLLSMNLIRLAIAFAFGTVERNFNLHAYRLSIFSDFLDGMIYGGFFLAYYYYQHNRKQYQKLLVYNEALAKSKINQLKNQLNPHFLFNNLNVLDQFIEEDKEKASGFLNEFADIYRYVLKVSEKELVTIDEEAGFARQYFSLIRHRYGNAYQLNLNMEQSNGFIVPLTLQVLIENAVQHNLGTEENPVVITIEIKESILATNNINLKRNARPESGRALKNLDEQYRILVRQSVDIHSSGETFSVHIPIIQSHDL
ncbi:histidine kinase [uncultured Chryseobacterium sp.]|uniref:sensor histidine kinase n=1 Tax=uncultured Chryseobacterium sp. TaxID=259322 RepID=UPI0025EB5FFD|nr:histidine kinase [uncultured Chryseobacterium sp.]